jgi:gamma-glutamyltranspeptidase
MLAIGAAGGRRIPNGVFAVLLNHIVDGRSLEDAVTEPRLHTEGGLAIHAEHGRPEAEIRYLKRVGYTITGPQQCYVEVVGSSAWQTIPREKAPGSVTRTHP